MIKELRKIKKIYTDNKRRHPSSSWREVLLRTKTIGIYKDKNRELEYVCQLEKCFDDIHPKITFGYLYPFNSWLNRTVRPNYKTICSITVDYETVLESSLDDLLSNLATHKDSNFRITETRLIDAIKKLADTINIDLSKDESDRARQLRSFWPHFLNRKPQSLKEAIQKILFYDALFWQANHWHIGKGRLDKILYPYYVADIEKSVLTKDEAINEILNLVNVIGKDIYAKSKTLKGDTGQYILLGGVDENGLNVENDLTFVFLDIFSKYKSPDPKLILRVNENTSSALWSKAVSCVCQGSGSPLFMNETPILTNMKMFGYEEKDLSNLGTSACWEPLIIGKSFDQNNTLPCIVTAEVLNNVVINNTNAQTFDEIYDKFKEELVPYISKRINDIQYDCSPLFSLFFDNCIDREKDFTEGGAKYAYHGIQVLSFPNTINALLNIKSYVFDKNLISLSECKDAIISNFSNNPDIKNLLLCGDNKYGSTSKDVVELSNDLMAFIGNEVAKYEMNGKPVKVGFSSPDYISRSSNTRATLDGRCANEPFAVHISPSSSNIDIAEVLDFASRLNYTNNRINGNIVDFTIPHSYLENQDKLVSIIRDACRKGLFELQLNVLDYEKLVDAKAHPEKYPDLIVRVWGFSAYFNDLPEEYKDNLIERARLYES